METQRQTLKIEILNVCFSNFDLNFLPRPVWWFLLNYVFYHGYFQSGYIPLFRSLSLPSCWCSQNSHLCWRRLFSVVIALTNECKERRDELKAERRKWDIINSLQMRIASNANISKNINRFKGFVDRVQFNLFPARWISTNSSCRLLLDVI